MRLFVLVLWAAGGASVVPLVSQVGGFDPERMTSLGIVCAIGVAYWVAERKKTIVTGEHFKDEVERRKSVERDRDFWRDLALKGLNVSQTLAQTNRDVASEAANTLTVAQRRILSGFVPPPPSRDDAGGEEDQG